MQSIKKPKLAKLLIITVFICVLLLSSLALSSCNKNDYIDNNSGNHAFSSNCLNKELAVLNDHIIKYRKDVNNIALASFESDTIKLNGNFDMFSPDIPLGFVEFNNYVLAFHNANSNPKIKLYDSQSSSFTQSFKPFLEYSFNGSKLVKVERIENELFIVLLVSPNYAYSIEKEQNGEKTDINPKKVSLNDFSDGGYLVLKLTTDSNNKLNETVALLGGTNAKSIEITKNGIYAIFRTKESKYTYVKYGLSDFSMKKNVKISGLYIEQYYLDGDYSIFLMDTTHSYPSSYKLSAFDSNLNKKDSLNIRKFYLDEIYFTPNKYYLFNSPYLSDNNKYTCIEVTFDGKTLKKKESNPQYKSLSNTVSFDNLSNVTLQVNNDQLSLVDKITKNVLSVATIPLKTIDTALRDFYYDETKKLLFFRHHNNYYDNSNAFNQFMIMDTSTMDGKIFSVDIGVSSLQLNNALSSSILYEGFSIQNDNVYLIYNCLIRQLDLELNELNYLDLRQTVTIYFLNEDGSQAAPPQLREVGGKITSEEIRETIPFKDGYKFVKWLNKDGGKLYNLKSDVVLTAVWEVDNEQE